MDVVDRQPFCFPGERIPAQVQSNLYKNPGAKSTKTPPNVLFGRRFCALEGAVPEATRCGEREARSNGHSSGKKIDRPQTITDEQ
jgi:hypothetical protein